VSGPRFPRLRLCARTTEPATLLVRGARLKDPRAGIDGIHDLLIRDGDIAEIGTAGGLEPPPGCEVVDG
jgi:imidazolonepropionase-like amidohydrolase